MVEVDLIFHERNSIGNSIGIAVQSVSMSFGLLNLQWISMDGNRGKEMMILGQSSRIVSY